MSMKLIGIAGAAVALVAGVGVLQTRRHTVSIQHPVPWAASGVWLKAETHVHSKFSDGGHTVDELVDRAVANGCDVLAITDHTDDGLKAATPAYHSAIAAGRGRAPQLVLLTGIEWNVPPGKGQDHAVVLFPPDLDDVAITGEFKRRFDDEHREGENPELAAAAFDWLRARAGSGSMPPVMFLDHPSRIAKDLAAVRAEIAWLSKIGEGVFAGVEGAPGHQHARRLGAYGGALTPDDRWDPAIAPPGAIWDQLLAAGGTMSGALATSDFHGESNGDYWPGEFSATWIYAPDRTATGVLRALRAGTFVGVHGGIARGVQLSVAAEGLQRAAIAGERLRIREGRTVTIELRADVPVTDWQGQPNTIDLVELIGTTPTGTSILKSGALDAGVLRYETIVPDGGLIVRARGRRVVPDGPDLLFYTNPVWIRPA